MKQAVIVAHPNAASFNVAVANAYCERVRALGWDVTLRDLYRLGFDPRLAAGEIPGPGGFRAGEDVLRERAEIADADVFVFVYPLWFNAPPAMLKGYLDRVFAMGFGYGPVQGGGNEPLLVGRSMLTFSTSGAPTEWLAEGGGLESLRNLFDRHFAAVCGLEVLDHVHFGGVVPNLRADVGRDLLGEVRAHAGRLFQRQAATV